MRWLKRICLVIELLRGGGVDVTRRVTVTLTYQQRTRLRVTDRSVVTIPLLTAAVINEMPGAVVELIRGGADVDEPSGVGGDDDTRTALCFALGGVDDDARASGAMMSIATALLVEGGADMNMLVHNLREPNCDWFDA